MRKNSLKTLIIKHKWELLFLLLTTFAHSLILMLPTQLAYGDLAPFPERWQQGFEDFFYAWREISFGIYRHPGNITNFIQSVLILIFRTPLIAQKFYIVYLLPSLAFFSARHLLKKHFNATEDAFLFVTSVFYTYSPIMLAEFTGGTQYSTMLIFALFPTLASLSLDILYKQSNKSELKLLLLLSLLFSIYIQLFIIYAIFLGVLFVSTILDQQKKLRILSLIKTGFIFGAIIFLALLANPIYSASNFLIVNPIGNDDATHGFANNINVFINDVKYTYSKSSLLNTIRLGGNVSDLRYTGISWWTTPFLLLSLVTLGYSIYQYNRQNAKQKVFITGYILTTAFIYATYLQYTYPIFLKIPVLFMFRNPAKLTMLNTLFFYVIFYCTFRNMQFKYNKYIYVGIYAAVVLYAWPLFLGDRGLSLSRNDFTVPQHYYAVQEAIKKDAQAHTYRTIWLPSTYEIQSIKLTWLDRNRIEDQLGLSEFSTDNYGSYIVKTISKAVIAKDSKLFKNLLNAANINYVVLTKDLSDNIDTNRFYSTLSINHGYKVIDDLLVDNKVIFENEYHKIYKLEDTPAILYTTNKVADLNYKMGSSSAILQEYFKNSSIPIVRNPKAETNAVIAQISAEDLSNHVLEWDEHWSWPEPSLNPQNPIYPLVLLKEKIGFSLRKDTMSKIDFAGWIIAKRAAETSKYSVKGERLNLLADNMAFYANFLNDFYKTNTLTTDLHRDTAVKAYVYLNRADETSPEYQTILNPVHTRLYDVIKDGYKDLCTIECIKVDVASSADYYQLGTNNKFSFTEGENKIHIKPQDGLILSKTGPSSNESLVYNLDNLNMNNKYSVDFDYETGTDIYRVNLFTQYKDKANIRYKYEVYLQYLLTSNGQGPKHFRAFFQPKPFAESTTYFKIEKLGQETANTINVTNINITPLSNNSVVLLNKPLSLDKVAANLRQIAYSKVSPSEYKIEVDSLPKETSYLIFADNYNPGWQLYNDENKIIKNETHNLVNSYGNIWELNPDELANTKNIYLRFRPQQQLNISLIWSLAFVSGVLFLLYKKDQIKFKDKY